MDGDDLSKDLDLQIAGAEQPTPWRLIGVGFILLPYTLGKVSSYLLSFPETSVVMATFILV
jgi:hypothetical protein